MSRCEELIAVSRVVPLLAQSQTASITIDGVSYRVPRIDSSGRVYTNAYAAGASEVKAARRVSSAPSSTRSTIATPTAGKKIRIITLQLMNYGATGTSFEVYFGSGISLGTSPGKEVGGAWLGSDVGPNHVVTWPDGAGPVGGVGEVVSLRTAADIGTAAIAIIHYREE